MTSGVGLLTHKCGGLVALDASVYYRLIAPSFDITSTGITRYTIDILRVPNDNFKISPRYLCATCGEVLDEETLKTDVFAQCCVCGKKSAVETTGVHTQVPFLCTTCVKDLKKGTGDITSVDEYIQEFLKVFQFGKTVRTVPLIKVLLMPIKI